jgi:hypothetical protein
MKRTVAVALLIVGVTLLVVPGPGVLFLAVGAALLAEDSYPLARQLDHAELRARDIVTALWRKARGN